MEAASHAFLRGYSVQQEKAPKNYTGKYLFCAIWYSLNIKKPNVNPHKYPQIISNG